MSEYNNTSPQSNSCAYATLGAYNSGVKGYRASSDLNAKRMVLPGFDAPGGYSSLQSSVKTCGGPITISGSCNGYSNIGAAYGTAGNGSACSSQFVSRLMQS